MKDFTWERGLGGALFGRDRPKYVWGDWARTYLENQGKPATSIWANNESPGASTMLDLLGVNNGSYVNDPTLGSPPLLDDDGTSVSFDGINQYAQVAHDPALNPGAGGHTAWVWIDFQGTRVDLLDKRDGGVSNGLWGFRVNADGSCTGFYKDEAGNQQTVSTTAGTVTTGVSLIALRYDGTETTMVVDGVQVGADSTPVLGDLTTNDHVLRLARTSTSYSALNADELGVAQHYLTDAELAQMYSVGLDRNNR